MARALRITAKWAAGLLLGIIGLVLVLFGLVQTGPGKSALAGIASHFASSPGLKVAISDISGVVPTNMRIGRITAADAKGTFAEVDALALSWSPLALLRGVVDVTHAGADRVELARIPELPEAPPAPPAKSSGGISLLPVRLGRLAIDEIVVGAPVMGHAAELSLTASADLMASGPGLAADFEVLRRDAPGTIGGTLRYLPQTRHLKLDLSAHEPAGGLVAGLMGIEGLPPVEAKIAGAGPLDAFDATIAMAAGAAAKANGTVAVRQVADGHRIQAVLDADVARLLPANIAPLFAETSELKANAVARADGLVDVADLSVRASGFGLAAKGRLDPAGAGSDLAFDVVAGAADQFAALAPGLGWQALRASGTMKGALAAPAAAVRVNATDLAWSGYKAGSLTVNAGTRPANGDLLVSVDGAAARLTARDPKVAKALGETARFTLSALNPAKGDPALTGFTADLNALSARFTGTAGPKAADGTLHVEKLDLAAFGPLAGRPLAGTAKLDVGVKGTDAFRQLALTLSGGTEKVATGIAAVDGLFGGATRLAGGLERAGADAFTVKNLTLAGTGLDLAVDGRLSPAVADLKARVALDDLKRIDPKLSGRLEASAAFAGKLDALGVDARLAIPQGIAMGQRIESLALTLAAKDLTGLPSGSFKLDGRVAGKPANGGGSFALGENGAARLDGLDLAIGSVTARGNVARGGDGLFAGRLAVAAGNLADLSAFALTELAGRLDADLALSADGGRQAVAVRASADNVRGAGQAITSARIDMRVLDPAGRLGLDGTANLSGVNAGGVAIPRAALTARPAGDANAFTLDAEVNGMSVAGNGRLSRTDAATIVRLERLNASRGGASVATSAPATFTIADGAVAIDRLALASRGGTATVAGRAGESLDLSVDIRTLPLAIAELAAPGLNLGGTLSGTARLRGPAARPEGTYDLQIARMTTPDVASAGAGPFDIRAQGDLAGGRVNTRTTVAGPNLSGLSITGSAPMGAGGLDLAIRGSVDLRIANATLAASGSQMAGTAAIDATVRGTASEPRAGGTVRISGGRFLDSVNGVNLDRIEGVITGTERTVTVTSLTARTPNGGGLEARGNVNLDPAANFPGRIAVTLNNAGLINSELVRLVAEGQVVVEGQFTADPRVNGRIVVRAMDVNIAERMPGGVQALAVRHVNDRRGGKAARPRASPAGGARPQPARATRGMPLDITVSADNNVFVRGMGMQAELGGTLKVTGTSAQPITDGGFEMRRGQFDVLGRRLNFTRGKITFTGSTDPELDFVAETTSNDITARILVTGPASRPDITFGSTPTLPQDEVLARLMFNRSAGSLTAGQAVQVAATIAQFSGAGAGVMDQMRRSLGVDTMDVGANEAGTGGQVGMGKRINDRIYMGVRQGTTPNSSQVTVDVDITRNIRLQGATGADGSTSVGVGAQWDY